MTDDRSAADRDAESETIDARGLLCPLPIVRTARALHLRPAGTPVELLADDPAICQDLPAWCQAMGHDLLGMQETDGVWRCRLRKGKDRAPE